MSLVTKTLPAKYANADISAQVAFMNNWHIDATEASYGAPRNDTGNAALGINAAMADIPITGGVVFLPPGTYRLTTAIVYPTDRQVRLVGAGPFATQLHVVSGTTATPGIIHIRGSELRSSVEQLSIVFDQPDTATRASMTHYVPAFYAQGIARFRIQHVRVARAWDVLDMRGNSNCEVNDLEMSHFNTGIQIDGSLDTIRLAEIHDWPFYLSANQTLASYDALNYGIVIGRTDGTQLSNSLFLCGTAIKTIPSVTTTGAAVLNITNCGFDTFNGLVHTAGNVRVSNSTFGSFTSTGHWAVYAVTAVANNFLQMSNCFFLSDAGSTNPLVEVRGIASGGLLTLNINGCQFSTGLGDQSSVIMDATLGGIIHATITDNHFLRTGNTAYTDPTLYLGENVRATIANNIARDKGTGAGDFVSSVAADQIVVQGNSLLGWGLNYAAVAHPLGNNNSAAVMTGTNVERSATAGFIQAAGINALSVSGTPPFALRRYTGTLNGSGAAAVVHSLGSLHQTGLIIQAWYKGGGGAMIPLTIGSIDGTNVNLSGGTASAVYRLMVVYSSNPDVW